MVKHTGATGETRLTSSPAADYAFLGGDVMLVMGPEEALRDLRIGKVREG